MAEVVLKGVRKAFGRAEIIRGVDLTIGDREFVVFVGPSGCGKSTLLRLIAGLEDITSGDLFMDGARVNDLPPAKRGIAMVFQSYALYPHMTVYQNMAFGLEIAKASKQEIDARIRRTAEILEISPLLDRKPRQLSGGQRQRVAIGRAIVREPRVFLFDEPLSNLDAALRVQMRIEITKLHHDLNATMIYVTHDQVEAMTLADRIVILKGGEIEQVGTPDEVYGRPANRWVAGFLGEADVVPGTAGDGWVECELARVPAEGVDSGEAEVLVRPESVALSIGPAAGGRTQVEGVVVEREFFGHDQLVHVELPSGRRLRSRSLSYPVWHPGDRVRVQLDGPVNVFARDAVRTAD